MPEGSQSATSVSDDRQRQLRPDCERCFALCCVVPAFSASADFAIDKSAGQPCPNLRPDFRCSIHHQLRPRGFPGCASYDCFGAGQQVAQITFGGRDWREAPETAARMFQSFTVMRQLHELLWYLSEALALPAARSLHGELRAAFEKSERLTGSSPQALAELDVGALREDVNTLLLRTSGLARAAVSRSGSSRPGAGSPTAGSPEAGSPETGNPETGNPEAGSPTAGGPAAGSPAGSAEAGSPAGSAEAGSPPGGSPAAARPAARRAGASLNGADLRGADLTGKDLSHADLSGASLRGACLIGAKLSGADLSMADLTGADLRGTDLSGADLSASIFLTQSQLDAARGDADAKLPPMRSRPAHWPPGP